MKRERDEELEPGEGFAEESADEVAAEPQEARPELSAELLAAGRADKPAWKSGKGPGRWATIGCGLGIAMLVVALFAGSGLVRKTVWAGFAGARQRLVASVSGDVQPGERMRLTGNLDAFAASLKQHDEPFPIMGEFQDLARKALEDSQVTRSEVEELNAFLESKLAESRHDVPYSMP